MKYAWIEESRIRDICQGGDPFEHYHPEVAALYDTEVPDEAENGDGWVDGLLVKPKPPAIQPMPVLWTVEDIRFGLTLVERVKWDNDASMEIKTAKIELSTPRFKAHTKEVLDMLVASGDISQGSADVILAKTNDKSGFTSVTVI